MKKFLIVVFILAVLGVGGFFGYKHFFTKSEVNKPAKKVYTDKIKGYGYNLEKRDTKLFKEKFEELKSILKEKNVDFEEYAKVLAQLYIIDLYTISNKDTTYDVGSTEFIYPDALENYELKVKDTLYRYIEDNTDKKRKQELPEVKSIKVKSVKKDTYELKIKDDNDNETSKTLDSYIVELSWDYKKDLGYDKEAKVILVKDEKGKKLHVVEQTGKDTKKDTEEDDE